MMSSTHVPLAGRGYGLGAMPLPRWEPARLAQAPTLPLPSGQEIKSIAASFFAVPTILAALTSYVGFRLGSKDEGVPAVLGYAVGTLI
jgi:hypothetical protein